MTRDGHGGTIFALASGKGRAGVAVVRLSGPRAGETLKRLTNQDLPIPRMALLANLIDPRNGGLIDRALVLWFPGPESFTGEDVAELHIHGSRAVLGKLFEVLSSFKGLRLAEPGEFTRRAFEHGKMDLTQAEGLHDLVFAETEAQRTQALHQLEGGLSKLYDSWREKLASCLADLEATIDFSEEEIPEGLLERVQKDAALLKNEIEKTCKDFGRGQAIRRGYRIVLLGPTNVGKSSLLNALAKEDKAIVSDIAGTTRDVIEVHLDMAGYSVVLVDTAGLREAGNVIEEEGIRRAQIQAGEADLKLILCELKDWPNLPGTSRKHLDGDSLVVLTKSDLVKGKPQKHEETSGVQVIPISLETGSGMDKLLEVIEVRVVKKLEAAAPAAITRIRHRQALEEGLEALRRFESHDIRETDPAILAEDIRLAARALGRVTGQVGVEDILDKIFSRFCIGK
ncbi:MAG: tRNA uridine-5-carboxymethylaminomethyl(34) synthesis GTPase MnmE [Proteobacteria bacterium]|nr:tRNA uridine-5-carboxymethylaminomethyl(34) synthesis GTPase MnmE [Pseudomonadota bacterium]